MATESFLRGETIETEYAFDALSRRMETPLPVSGDRGRSGGDVCGRLQLRRRARGRMVWNCRLYLMLFDELNHGVHLPRLDLAERDERALSAGA